MGSFITRNYAQHENKQVSDWLFYYLSGLNRIVQSTTEYHWIDLYLSDVKKKKIQVAEVDVPGGSLLIATGFAAFLLGLCMFGLLFSCYSFFSGLIIGLFDYQAAVKRERGRGASATCCQATACCLATPLHFFATYTFIQGINESENSKLGSLFSRTSAGTGLICGPFFLYTHHLNTSTQKPLQIVPFLPFCLSQVNKSGVVATVFNILMSTTF